MEIRPQLREQLRQLKMPGMWHALETRLAEARQTELGHLEFLSLLIQDELTNRENNMLATRIRNAGFGQEKTFAEFDFRFNDSALNAAVLRDLATCHFIGERRNVVIGGPPGIGKTHAAKAIGHEACRSTGCERCSAWIWLFSSTHSTTACSGGSRYSPTALPTARR